MFGRLNRDIWDVINVPCKDRGERYEEEEEEEKEWRRRMKEEGKD
jgi:hypothetical protein